MSNDKILHRTFRISKCQTSEWIKFTFYISLHVPLIKGIWVFLTVMHFMFVLYLLIIRFNSNVIIYDKLPHFTYTTFISATAFHMQL